MTTTELIITYIFYGAIIVIGLIVLGIIRTLLLRKEAER